MVDYVRDLKARSGADIGVHGSISVAQTLLQAELVDEVRLIICPIVVGEGKRLFDGVDGMQRLTLIKSQFTRSGYLLVHYQVLQPTSAAPVQK